jgi:hypothetical protein
MSLQNVDYKEEDAIMLWQALETQFEIGGQMAIVPDVRKDTVEQCLSHGKLALAWGRREGMLRYGFLKMDKDWWRVDVDVQPLGKKEIQHVADLIVPVKFIETLLGYLHKITADPRGAVVKSFTMNKSGNNFKVENLVEEGIPWMSE